MERRSIGAMIINGNGLHLPFSAGGSSPLAALGLLYLNQIHNAEETYE